MAQEQPDYLAYLLRLWRTGSKEKAVWRASLERSDTRQRKGFASLLDLFAFLRQQTTLSSSVEKDDKENGL